MVCIQRLTVDQRISHNIGETKSYVRVESDIYFRNFDIWQNGLYKYVLQRHREH